MRTGDHFRWAFAQDTHRILQGSQALLIERIVDPPAFRPIANQPRLFENFEMKGETRLRGSQRIHEVTDTLLVDPETLKNLQPSLIGKRMEDPRGLGALYVMVDGHRIVCISTLFDKS